jgi:Putative beta-barrel porin-2, OmpL-like. bbp2
MLFLNKKQLILSLFLLFFGKIYAQKDTLTVTLSGYAEVYYGFDFQKPTQNERPAFLYNHKRHNEVNVNLAYLKFAVSKSKTRANIALMTGNYAQYNLAAEPSVLRSILEANVGVRLAKTQNWWLDLGVLPSHIGFESAVSADCPTVTRSLVAENSPYFETGARLSFSNKKGNFSTAFLLLNGWQRIQRVNGNSKPMGGFQVNFKPKSGFWTLNYSNFFGSDKPSPDKNKRHYHNFYAIYDAAKKWSFTAGYDIGVENVPLLKSKTWQTPVAILTHRFSEKWRVTGRAEYFNDPGGALTSADFRVFGQSLNVDYLIEKNVFLRFEQRVFSTKNEAIFNGKNQNWSAVFSLAAKF